MPTSQSGIHGQHRPGRHFRSTVTRKSTAARPVNPEGIALHDRVTHCAARADRRQRSALSVVVPAKFSVADTTGTDTVGFSAANP